MHEPGSSGLRRQSISNVAMRGHGKTLLFGRPIYGRRDDLTVPVDELRRVGLVEQIDGHRDALAKAD
jgi:hypothetical protein